MVCIHLKGRLVANIRELVCVKLWVRELFLVFSILCGLYTCWIV